jgi:hypothetical protein
VTIGSAFGHTRSAAVSPVIGSAFSNTRSAAVSPVVGSASYQTRGEPLRPGVKAKQLAASIFGPNALGRGLFGADVFDLATSNNSFETGAIATTKLVDTLFKADGTVPMAADLALGTNKITGLSDGTAATDAATKGQLDSAVSGISWKDPVNVRELVGSSTVAGINGLSPTLGDAYIATDAGTPTAGTSDALVIGSLTEYDGTSWKEIVAGVGGFPPDGTRAMASIQTTLNGTIGLTDGVDDGKLLQWGGASLTPTETTSLDGDSSLINGDGSVFEHLAYTYNGVVPTGSWVQFYGASTSSAGAGLTVVGVAYDVGDINRGIQANADDLEIDASEIAATSGGLKAGVNSWQLTVEPADFAGTGLEDDGADNLRLALQGNGIAGGAGVALSIQPDTTGGAGSGTVASTDTAQVDVSSNGVGIDVTRLDGDHLDITFTPSVYTPNASPPEASDVDDLAAHLKGIDDAIGAAGGTPRQESVTAQNITGTDTPLTDTLNNTPLSAVTVELYLNGALQEQGAGADYTISGTTVTWLASSGTAVNMLASDLLIATYES